MDVDNRWDAMKREIERREIAVFPSRIDAENAPVARWPETREDAEFLDLCEECGVNLLYAFEEKFEEDDLPLWGEENRAHLDALIATARSHLGKLIFVSVSWVHGGIIHEWSREAAWFAEFEEQMELLNHELAERTKVDVERNVMEQARQLASQPEFHRARTPQQREYIARKVFPDLDEEESDFSWTIHRLVREAQAIYEVDILPVEEQAIADRARELMAEGRPRSNAAEEIGISDDKLKRILQTHPPA